MKRFVILGIPRSGTKFLCNTLDKYSDISFPVRHEPFTHLGNAGVVSDYYDTSTLDVDGVISKFPTNQYSGFKVFPGTPPYDIKRIIKQYDMKVIGLIRRDGWKVLGSNMVATQQVDFGISSKMLPQRYYYSQDNMFELTHMMRVIDHYLMSVYTINQTADILLHFEELIEDGYTKRHLNSYFKRRIEFNSGYDDSHDYSHYFENFDVVKKAVLKYVDKNIKKYDIVPSWALDNLYNAE